MGVRQRLVPAEGFCDPDQDHPAGRQPQGYLNLLSRPSGATPVEEAPTVLDSPSAPLHILIFGINYVPEPAGIGPFTTGVAEHYARRGHLVTVVTGTPHYPAWRPSPVPRPAGKTNPVVRRYRHAIPRQPRALGRLAYESTWLLTASRSLTRGACDVILGVVPSLSGGLLAFLASKRFHAPFGLVCQDVMGLSAAESGYAGGRGAARGVARLEQGLARRASAVGVISPGFRCYFEAAGVSPGRIVSLRNWARWTASSTSVAATRARLNWSPSDFICLHAGSMGQKQGLETVVHAARLLKDTNVRIVLAGDGNDRVTLERLGAGLGVDRLSFLPTQPEGEYEAMLEAADTLLVSQRDTVGQMSMPSRLATYFRAGRPVIAAVAAHSAAARELEVSQAGIVVPPADPAQLAAALIDMRDGPDERRRSLGSRGTAYAERYLTADAAMRGYDRFLCEVLETQPKATRASIP